MKEVFKNLGKVRPTIEGDWNKIQPYSLLSIVYNKESNKSYISKKDVPENIEITNKEYWQCFGSNRIDSDSIILLSNIKEQGVIKSYSLQEAIASISPDDRRVGVFISFYEKPNAQSDVYRWNLYQFNSNNVSDWSDETAWCSIYFVKSKFYGWFINKELLYKTIENPSIGDYAFVGSNLGEAVVYLCYNEHIWSATTNKATDYLTIIFKGTITIGENGNWYQNGEDTGIPAKGEKGDKPYFRFNDTTGNVEYSFNQIDWEILVNKEEITGAAATVTVGTVTTLDENSNAQVTNSGTTNAAILNFKIPKGKTGDGLIIKGTYDTEKLLKEKVTSPKIGDNYVVGTAAPYHLWCYTNVYNGGTNSTTPQWKDLGELTKDTTIITQSLGNKEDIVPSQALLNKESSKNNSISFFINPRIEFTHLIKEIYLYGNVSNYSNIRPTSIKKNYNGLWQFTIRGDKDGKTVALFHIAGNDASFESQGLYSVFNYGNTKVNGIVLLDWTNIPDGTNIELTNKSVLFNDNIYNILYSPTIKLQKFKEVTNCFISNSNSEKVNNAIVALNINKGNYTGNIYVSRILYKFKSSNGNIMSEISFCEESPVNYNKIIASYRVTYNKDKEVIEPNSNIKLINNKYNIIINIIINWNVLNEGEYVSAEGLVNENAYNNTINPSFALLPTINNIENNIASLNNINTINFTKSELGNTLIKELYIADNKNHKKLYIADVKRAYYIKDDNIYSWQITINYEDSNEETGRFGSFVFTGSEKNSFNEQSFIKFTILNEGSNIYALVNWNAINIGSQDFSKKEITNYAFDLNYSPAIAFNLRNNIVQTSESSLYMIKDRFLSFSVDKEDEITSLIVNKNSTQETKNLFWNLKKNAYDYKIIFGQHRTNETGVLEDGTSWDLRSGNNFSTLIDGVYVPNDIGSIEWRSDINRVSGYKPFLLSEDLGYSVGEYYSSVKEKNAADIIGACKKFYKETNGIITFSFHFQNPWYSYEEEASGDPHRYKSKTHPNVLKELTDNTTILHDNITVTEWFNGLLDEWAEIINNITDEEDNLISVIIRPFHECSTNAFWWGHDYGTPKEYKDAFIYFVNRIISKCNNVLIAYSPDRNWTSMKEDDLYMDRYPGDDYVDIMGYDDYSIGTDDINNNINRARLLTREAEVRKKIPALTESGNNKLTTPKWFNDCLYKVLNDYEVRFAYSLVWGNESASMYYTPYLNSGESTDDFKKFMNRKDIIKSESNIDYYNKII